MLLREVRFELTETLANLSTDFLSPFLSVDESILIDKSRFTSQFDKQEHLYLLAPFSWNLDRGLF